MTIEQASKVAQTANRLASLLKIWESVSNLSSEVRSHASKQTAHTHLALLASLATDISNTKIELDLLENKKEEKDA